MNKDVFYCNEPCEVIGELENDEVVIKIEAGEYYGDDFDYPEVYPVERTLIVNKKYISPNRINIQDTISSEIKKAETEARDIIRKAKIEAQGIIKTSKEKKDNIEYRMKKIEGLKPYLDYLEGNIKYILYEYRYPNEKQYDSKILPVEEFDKKEREDDNSLRAYFLEKSRYRKESKVTIILNQYSDYSGSEKYKVQLFKNWEDLEKHVYLLLDNSERINNRALTDLQKWGFKHNLINEVVKQDKTKLKEQKKEKINKLEIEIKKLKENK